MLIGATIEGLLALDYPPELFCVHIVADHCTDRTADVARELGVTVHEHVDPEPRGKGPALHWAVNRLVAAGDDPDAVLVVDADTRVRRDVLAIMDARLSAGADVVQAHYTVSDPEMSANTAFRAAALAVRHYLRPLGRTMLGASSGLYGNGMAVRTGLLLDHPWTDHLTEDVEFQVELMLHGVRVDFAADAVVEAEMPKTLRAAQSQHERWERGRIDAARSLVPRLLARPDRSALTGRWARVDTAIDLVLPPFSVVVAGAAALAVASRFTDPAHPSARLVRRLAVATVLGQVAYVGSGLAMVRAKPAVYVSLLRAPFLVAWKVRLWLGMLVPSREVAWTRTTRNVVDR